MHVNLMVKGDIIDAIHAVVAKLGRVNILEAEVDVFGFTSIVIDVESKLSSLPGDDGEYYPVPDATTMEALADWYNVPEYAAPFPIGTLLWYRHGHNAADVLTAVDKAAATVKAARPFNHSTV